MKNKQNNWDINSQEDEDGFSLNPYEVFIDDNSNGNQELHSKRITANSEPGAVGCITIATKEKRFANKITNLQSV